MSTKRNSTILQKSGLLSNDQNDDSLELAIQKLHERYVTRAMQLYNSAKNISEKVQARSAFMAFLATADAEATNNVSSELRKKYTAALTVASQKVKQLDTEIDRAGGVASGGDDQLNVDSLCSQISPSVTFDELAGMQREKSDIETAFVYPMLFPSLFRSVKAVLMYGPPGTGKTELAKAAVASLNSGSTNSEKVLFFSADGASLKGKFVGETEKRIRGTFECAAAAAGEKSMSVIFMDEIDAIGGKRSAGDPNMATSVNALIASIEGAQSDQQFGNVKILSATNLPWRLDAALNRRFAQRIFVDLPNDLARMQIVSNKLQKYFIIDPLLRANEYQLRNVKDVKQRKLKAQINTHLVFLPENANYDIPKTTPEALQQLKQATVDELYPKLKIVRGPLRLEFVTNNADENTRWDKFLLAQNPERKNQFTLQDLLFVGMWTGVSKQGSQNLATLAKHYNNPEYFVQGGRSEPQTYDKSYPTVSEKNYAPLAAVGIDTSPQPSIYGYSASDVSKMVDQAFNVAALDFARGGIQLPNGDLCDMANRGLVKSVEFSQCARDSGCCQLLPTKGQPCPITSIEQRRCVRSNRITLRHFVEALDRFTSTVNPKEYCETVEYFLSKSKIEPGAANAICPSLDAKQK